MSIRYFSCFKVSFITFCFLSSSLFAQVVFKTPPKDFRPKFEVAGCYCECDGKILFMLRDSDKPQGDTWCIPGGKIEAGETPVQGLQRELKEETGMFFPLERFKKQASVCVRFPSRDMKLHLYHLSLAGKPENYPLSIEDHSDHCWVSVDEALQLELIPGGAECLEIVFGATSH